MQDPIRKTGTGLYTRSDRGIIRIEYTPSLQFEHSAANVGIKHIPVSERLITNGHPGSLLHWLFVDVNSSRCLSSAVTRRRQQNEDDVSTWTDLQCAHTLHLM